MADSAPSFNEPLTPEEEDSPELNTQPFKGVIPGGGQGDGVPSGDLKVVPPEQLADQEETPSRTTSNGSKLSIMAGGLAGAEAAAGASDTLGKGFTGAEAAAQGKVKQLVRGAFGNKKAVLGVGGTAGILTLVGIIFFGGITSFALVTIEKKVVAETTKIEKKEESKVFNNMLNNMLCRQTNGAVGKNCNKGTDDETNSEKEADDSNGELASEIDSTPLTDPEVVAVLEHGGVTVEQTDGQITGIKNAAGEDISDELPSDTSDLAQVDTSLSTVDQLEVGRPTVAAEGDVPFSGIPDTPDVDVDKTVADDVVKGADSADQAAAATEAGQGANTETPPPEGTPTTTDIAATGPLGNAINATEQEFTTTGDAAAAEATGTSILSDSIETAGDAVLITGLATPACNIKKSVTAAEKVRIAIMETRYVRTAVAVLDSPASQLESGHITASGVNQLMKLYTGDPSAKNKDGSPAVASESFNHAAGWHRLTGQAVGSDTPDIALAALPQKNAGSKVVDEINGIVNKIPGANLTCSVLTSPFGFIINGGVAVGQFFGDVGSWGISQVIITGANIGGLAYLNGVVLPDVLKYFTNIAVAGTNTAVQNVNNAIVGNYMYSATTARRSGALPLTNDQTNTENTEADAEQIAYNNSQPWTYRTFALDNPTSVASYIFDRMPILNFATTISSIENYLTSFPGTLLHNFSSLFTPKSLAQATQSPAVCADPTSNPNPANPYCVTMYGRPDSQIDKYDQIDNEKKLHSTVTVIGCHQIIKNKCIGPAPVTGVRISMLGDPTKYVDNPAGDSDKQDLLHCFVDSFTEFTPENDDSQKPFCGLVGTLDYTDLPVDKTADAIPDYTNIENIYCAGSSQTSLPTIAANEGLVIPYCTGQVAPLVINFDDANRFSQYLGDLNAVHPLASLAAKQ